LLTWYRPDPSVFEAAAEDKLPIVLYFAEEDLDPIDASRELHDADLAKLSEKEVMFVMIEYNSDRTPSLDTGCPVPCNKLLGPNPSRDYNITRYPSFLVCDWFGNEYFRFTKVPSAKTLSKRIEEVTDMVEAMDKKLASNLEDAKKALEEKDVKKFLKAADKNFRLDVIGLDGLLETSKLYHDLMDKTRDEVDGILNDRPEDGEKRLKDLSKLYRDTEVEQDIKDALDILKG